MVKLLRLNLVNIPQHVIQRGNNRGVCFFSDEDYAVYLDKLRVKEFSIKHISRLIQTLSSHYPIDFGSIDFTVSQ